MGKVEYDVFADGKKIGTASRDQTGFEKWLDDAAAESRYREAHANSTIATADRLSKQYAELEAILNGSLTKEEIEEMERKEKERKKRRRIAILLLVFLGSLGVHRFYLGNTKIGIYYIILFAAKSFTPLGSNFTPLGSIVSMILVVSLIIDLICIIKSD